MRNPTAVVDVDVAAPARRSTGLDGFAEARVLVRFHGVPVTFVTVPVVAGKLDSAALGRALVEQRRACAIPLVRLALASSSGLGHIEIQDLLAANSPQAPAGPHVTVAVCTRNRATDLAACLDSLMALDYPLIDWLVVDNDPPDDDTERLVRNHYPRVRYVRELRRGLDWARNRAVLECRGDILAFTDDDAIVDRQWVAALVEPFQADPGVMAVTGLVIPHELGTEAQHLFELYGGFGRGFVRRWYRAPAGRPIAMLHGGTGKFGTGANMAYRRTVFDEVGGFDPALDVGTAANGGGDLEMFFRVLKAGRTLVYAPSAIVRHRHRRTYAELRTQITNNGVGFYAYLRRSFHACPDERRAIVTLGVWWFRWWHLRRLLRSFAGKEPIPRGLIAAELRGSIAGLRRYPAAASRARAIGAAHPGDPQVAPRAVRISERPRRPEAVRCVDIAEPLRPIDDAAEYERLRIIVLWQGTALGSVSMEHHGAVVGDLWLADAIAQHLAGDILAAQGLDEKAVAAAMSAALAAHLGPDALPRTKTFRPLRSDVSVSVVVATRDRSADLQRCLESLVAQRSGRPLEIIVVDNSSHAAATAAVVDRFPGVVLAEERRTGLSYARNRGIALATGDIVITTDDDVTCPPGWIERLIAPFARQDVMVVTGNVLPANLEGKAERLFESYGGLSRGFTPRLASGDWFTGRRRAVPTWKLGCTANAAFRARIFADPDIGLMDEALGAGTPTGCSEDTYLFYRVLKAGYAVAYEPSAIVWHHHRQTMRALHRQIYNYSKGHVAYQLTTWLRDGDRRALIRIAYELPRTYARRAWSRVRRRSDYPLTFIALEVLGCFAGPIALWRSRRRVRRLGGSGRVPVRSSYAVHVEGPRSQATEA